MSRWVSRLVPIGLNALIPYLGAFFFRPRQFAGPLIFATALLALSAMTQNDVIAGSIYLRNVELGEILLLIGLFFHSSYLSLTIKDGPYFSWRRAILPIVCNVILATFAGFSFLYDGRSLKVASRSLEPILAENSIISLERASSLDRGELATARDSTTAMWRTGIVLARPGDTIGLVENIPVSCPSGAKEDDCYRIDNPCPDYAAYRPPTAERSVLPHNQIIVATSIRGSDQRILQRRVTFSDLYRVGKVFAPDRWLDFGTHPVVRDCPMSRGTSLLDR
jgi:hypothetical protein